MQVSKVNKEEVKDEVLACVLHLSANFQLVALCEKNNSLQDENNAT